MILYEIVMGTSIGALQDKVNEMIQEGWRPIGGVAFGNFMDRDGRNIWFYQAMIKEAVSDYSMLLSMVNG